MNIIIPIIIVVFIVLALLISVFSIRRIFELGKNARTGNSIDMTIVEGIPNMASGTVVNLSLEDKYIQIKSRIGDHQTARISYQQITNLGLFTKTQIIEKDRNVVGRAIVGGLLFGSLGAIIGGISGAQKPKFSTKFDHFLVINYTPYNLSKPAVLVFGVVGASWGLDKFERNMRHMTGIPPICNAKQTNEDKNITL